MTGCPCGAAPATGLYGLVDPATDVLIEVDREGQVTGGTPHVSALLARPLCAGAELATLVTAEVGRVLVDQVELVRSTGRSVSIELRDGARELRARIVPVEAGEVVLLRHPGEGTRARLARTTASDDSFWQLFEAAPLPLVLEVASTATGEGASRTNHKFTEMFGYTPDDVPTVQHWWSLAYPDPVYRATIRDEWFARVGRAVADGTAIAPMEATVTCKDGSRRAVEFFAAAVGDRHVVIFVDLTERKRAEELSELLPVCAWCKKLRDDQGYWQRLEEYVARRTGATVTHGICPDCVTQMRGQGTMRP